MASSATELPDADIIVDEMPHNGLFNMSMDAALLQLAAERERSVVRIYQWSEPTVTLGYFQGLNQDSESPFPGLPIVRRLSGGGAILHDREVTYSLILPLSHPARQNPSGVYETVHQAIIQLLTTVGVSSLLRSAFEKLPTHRMTAGAGPTAEPFLCFLRQNPNDIVHSSGCKIVGSAQRRRKGVILQHGSIILKASELVPQVKGIEDLEPEFAAVEFRQNLPVTIARSISRSLSFRACSDAETRLAQTIASEMGHKLPGDY
ncbi:MAG: lipoate--protein ligase family protein [Planctomycetaceae bacterium]|nr:lipoate--protein ligase family protein [Planctomycetaceae bacterium]